MYNRSFPWLKVWARAGHRVTLASHPVMRSLVESAWGDVRAHRPDIDLARVVAVIRSRSRNGIVGFQTQGCVSALACERSDEDIFTHCCSATWSSSPWRSRGKNEADQSHMP